MSPLSSQDDAALLSEFGKNLVQLAVPVLSRGYADVVSGLEHNHDLARLAKETGIDAVLSDKGIASFRKANNELVTLAEKTAESLMASAVKQRFPAHAIVGEEHGFTPGSHIRWVFDPIDGTSAMVRTAIAQAFGLALPAPAPSFGITIAIVDNEEAVLGIVTELRTVNGTLADVNTWIGEKNKPTTCNGQPVRLPPVPSTLSDAILTSTIPHVMFNTPEKWSGYQALAESAKSCIQDQNCIGFMRLLQEKDTIDIAYEADLAYHDVAALVPILQGAGIAVSDSAGHSLRFPESTITKEFSLLAAQNPLHKHALKAIRCGVDPAKNSFASRDHADHGYAKKFM